MKKVTLNKATAKEHGIKIKRINRTSVEKVANLKFNCKHLLVSIEKYVEICYNLLNKEK